MSRPFDTPQQALAQMVEAGAVFTIRARKDGLGVQFFYRVEPDGDLQACRRIMAAAKAKPPAFFAALRDRVQDIAERVDA